jgi:hypothetical protein
MTQAWLPANIAGVPDGVTVSVTGTLTKVEVAETHQRRAWANAVVETGDGSVRVQVYPKVYEACAGLLVDGGRVTVVGVMDRRADVPFVMAREVTG